MGDNELSPDDLTRIERITDRLLKALAYQGYEVGKLHLNLPSIASLFGIKITDRDIELGRGMYEILDPVSETCRAMEQNTVIQAGLKLLVESDLPTLKKLSRYLTTLSRKAPQFARQLSSYDILGPVLISFFRDVLGKTTTP